MNLFEDAELELIRFGANDVIATSDNGFQEEDDGGPGNDLDLDFDE